VVWGLDKIFCGKVRVLGTQHKADSPFEFAQGRLFGNHNKKNHGTSSIRRLNCNSFLAKVGGFL
jgi:hypothetical protein